MAINVSKARRALKAGKTKKTLKNLAGLDAVDAVVYAMGRADAPGGHRLAGPNSKLGEDIKMAKRWLRDYKVGRTGDPVPNVPALPIKTVVKAKKRIESQKKNKNKNKNPNRGR